MRSPVTLYLRVRSADGSWTYVKPVKTPNHKLKPLYGIVDGVPKRCPEACYVLRYRTADGKRPFEAIGTNPEVAVVAMQRKVAELTGVKHGLTLVTATPEPEAVKPSPKTPGRSIADAAKKYLLEIKAQKSKKTHSAYRTALKLFQKSCSKERLEDIDRDDMLAFINFLKATPQSNAPRTIRNRVDYLQIFFHHVKLPSILIGKDLPTYTKKRARAYSDFDLGKLFGVSDQEESELLNFLLCTGTREQEAQYACWSDIDLDAKTYTVTEHLDLGFKPKDKEEGTIPIPEFLAEILKERRKRYPSTRLIFPTLENKPNGHFLRIIKDMGLRAGLNCGHCINKAGKSCADTPTCKHVILHKLRKTFASVLSKKGIAPRTIMRYLRHSDLTTTLMYLDDQDDDHTRAVVDSAFNRIGGAA